VCGWAEAEEGGVMRVEQMTRIVREVVSEQAERLTWSAVPTDGHGYPNQVWLMTVREACNSALMERVTDYHERNDARAMLAMALDLYDVECGMGRRVTLSGRRVGP
jgi:hypothetical protein